MKTINQKGFTLVELMMAILAGSIVLIGAGSMLIAGHLFWNQAWEEANLQRDASYALQSISRSLKVARSAEILNGGDALKIYHETDEMEFYLDGVNNDLKCRLNGGQPRTILIGNVEYLQFKVDVNKVQVELKLREDKLQTRMTSTVAMRNYQG